ncbi:MAG: DUF6285 domain-containing protein [Bdellovibrionota bacterium]
MQDRPSAKDLLEALADFLEREAVPVVEDPRLRFRLMIAGNLARILEREADLEETLLQSERKRLLPLLGKGLPGTDPSGSQLREEVLNLNQDFGRRIRAGEMDMGPAAQKAFAHALATLEGKLAVANPKELEKMKAERKKS